MAITLRNTKGSALTYTEMDDNFREVQTLMDKAYVSVTDFGAVGDGVTDDTVAIQAAATAASGGKLFFPEGTYIGVNISIPSDIHVFGNATLKLKQQTALSFNPFFRLTAANVSFDGLVFDGNKANQPADGFSDSWNTGASSTGKSNRAAIYADNFGTGYSISNVSVKGCEFKNQYGASIALRDVSNFIVDGNTFKDSNLEAVFAYAGGVVTNTKAVIVNNRVSSLGTGDGTVNANAFVLSSYDNVVIANNNAYSVERNLVKLESCNDVSVTGNVLDTNTVTGFNCLQFQAGATRVSIVGNVFKNVQKGIYAEVGAFSDFVVSNNVVETALVESGTPDGVAIYGCERLAICNNILKDISRNGIIASNCSQVTISNNVISPNASASLLGSGVAIAFTADISNVVVSNNQISLGFIGANSTNNGGVYFSGTGKTLTNGVVSGNIVNTLTNAATDRGIRAVLGTFTNFILRDNYTAGIIECTATAIGLNNLAARNIPTNAYGQVIGFGSSAPASGAHYIGEVQLHSAPAAAGNIGWVCTTAGTPGTWKTFGTIES